MFICLCVSVYKYNYIMSCVSLFVFLRVQIQMSNAMRFFVCVSLCSDTHIMSCVSLFVFPCAKAKRDRNLTSAKLSAAATAWLSPRSFLALTSHTSHQTVPFPD